MKQHLVDEGVEVADDEPLPGYDRLYAFDPFGNRSTFDTPMSPCSSPTASRRVTSPDRLGHKSTRTVLDVYGDLYANADEVAMEGLERLRGAA